MIERAWERVVAVASFPVNCAERLISKSVCWLGHHDWWCATVDPNFIFCKYCHAKKEQSPGAMFMTKVYGRE